MEEKAILQACNNSCVCVAKLKFLFPFHVYGGLKDPAGLSVSHRDVPAFNSHSCDLDMSSGDVSDPVASRDFALFVFSPAEDSHCSRRSPLEFRFMEMPPNRKLLSQDDRQPR